MEKLKSASELFKGMTAVTNDVWVSVKGYEKFKLKDKLHFNFLSHQVVMGIIPHEDLKYHEGDSVIGIDKTGRTDRPFESNFLSLGPDYMLEAFVYRMDNKDKFK